MRVPEQEPAGERDDDVGLYELAASAEAAMPAAQAAATAASVVSRPVTVPSAAAVKPKGLAYENARARGRESDRLSYDRLTDPVRDLYVPVGMLVVGFLAVLAWGVYELSAGSGGIAVVSVGIGVTTLVKTVVVTALALVVAPHLGVSFGTLGSGILKFAAILILADAALLWLDVLMQSTGAMPSSGGSSRSMRRGLWWINILASTAIISAASWYLFDMDSEETGTFAVPFAIVSWIVGLVLKLVTIAILSGMLAAPAPAPVPAVPVPPGTATFAAPVPPVPGVQPTERDLAIAEHLKVRKVFVAEGREWRRGSGSYNNKPLGELIEELYVKAGATKVLVERSIGARSLKAYVELPTEPEGAAEKARAEVRALVEAKRFTIDTSGGETRQYVVINVPAAK
jgi:hypothetical protein